MKIICVTVLTMCQLLYAYGQDVIITQPAPYKIESGETIIEYHILNNSSDTWWEADFTSDIASALVNSIFELQAHYDTFFPTMGLVSTYSMPMPEDATNGWLRVVSAQNIQFIADFELGPWIQGGVAKVAFALHPNLFDPDQDGIDDYSISVSDTSVPLFTSSSDLISGNDYTGYGYSYDIISITRIWTPGSDVTTNITVDSDVILSFATLANKSYKLWSSNSPLGPWHAIDYVIGNSTNNFFRDSELVTERKFYQIREVDTISTFPSVSY